MDAVFGFAYAQAEDNWQLIEDSINFYRGTAASTKGIKAAKTDYLIKWLGIWDTIDREYDKQLKPETRQMLNAYVDGINYYVAEQSLSTPFEMPVTAKDIVAGYMIRHLLFYGFDKTVAELLGETRAKPVERNRSDVTFRNTPIGSNAIAVAPHLSDDGATRLAINSHQPLTGPVAWYEAHIQSDEGLNIMGGMFPGSPTIGVGFNHNIAWGVTVNKPDLVDIYVLEIDVTNPLRYKLDGKWHDLDVENVTIKVKLFGFLPWSVKRKVLRSKHGPVFQTKHGTYAVRYAGMNEIRQVEQWWTMNKAQNFEQWLNALKMHSFSSFNFVFADKTGNIYFIHNSQTPHRITGYNWNNYLPGNDSALIWQDYLPFDKLPQSYNPKSGFLLSANQSPFYITSPEDNPDSSQVRIEDGFPTRMTNRAVRGLELFEQLGTISKDEFYAIKHDKTYSRHSRAGKFLQSIINLEINETVDDRYHRAQSILKQWDYSADIENTNAALSICIIGVEWQAEQKGESIEELLPVLKLCADKIYKATGKLNPKWGDINRHVRGNINLPVGGGPDTLRAIYGTGIEQKGFNTNVAGDGLYYLVEWDKKGKLNVEGVHQFGSATLDENSPHYSDQTKDYVNEVLHDPLFDAQKRQGKIERSYRLSSSCQN